MKVLIINQHGLNRGDEAAARGLASFLDKEDGISQVDILYNIANMDKREELILIKSPKIWNHHSGHRPSFVEKALIIFTFILPFPLVRTMFKILSGNFRSEMALIESSQLIINAPGGVNIGIYVDWVYLWRLYVALKLKKPVAIYSISFGPLPQKAIFKKASLYVLRNVKFLSLRDKKSQEYAGEYQIPFRPAIDTAFLDNDPMDSLPPELDYLKARPYMVMVPNQLHKWHPNFKNIPPEQIDTLYISIIDCILEQNVHIALLPQLFGRQNDSRYFESLKDKCRNREKMFCIEDKYDSYTQQHIIKNAQFLIGARYHSIVFAIRNHTPFFALSYEHKIEEMLSILNLSRCGVNLAELFAQNNIDNVISRIRDLFTDRNILRPKIETAEKKASKIALETYTCFQREFLWSILKGETNSDR